MEKVQLTKNEKELLTVLGKFPEISRKELLTRATYKWASTVVRKLEKLRAQHMIYGPLYLMNYSKLCRNPLHPLVSIMEIQHNFVSVLPYLECIESFRWIYPVLSPSRNVILAAFTSSNDLEMEAIFQLLKDNNIITSFDSYICRHKFVYENPNFFGDSNPSLDHLLDSCDVPDMSFGQYDTCWNKCDIAVLPYLLKGYKGAKLIEILKSERRLNKTWTYAQINYSHEKMRRNGLIEKKYVIYPYPKDQCTHFYLALRTEDIDVTLKILCNFAKGARMFKSYALYGVWGVIGCLCHPLFVADLMHKLDQIGEIVEKHLYQRRSITEDYVIHQTPELKYFDFDKQTLEYPYHVYKEKIKEKIDSE